MVAAGPMSNYFILLDSLIYEGDKRETQSDLSSALPCPHISKSTSTLQIWQTVGTGITEPLVLLFYSCFFGGGHKNHIGEKNVIGINMKKLQCGVVSHLSDCIVLGHVRSFGFLSGPYTILLQQRAQVLYNTEALF